MAPKKNPFAAKQPTRRQRRPRRRQPRAMKPFVDSRLRAAICSQVDPFCEHAYGAKMYDRDSTRSIARQVREYVTLSVDANGDGVHQFFPRLNDYRRSSQTITAGAVSAWLASADVPDYSSLNSNFQKYRIVSFGIRVFTRIAPINASGTIAIQTDAVLGDTPSLTSESHLESVRRAAAGADVAWISIPRDRHTEWRGTDTTDYHGFTGLQIVLSGCNASSSIVGVEVCMNIELIPEEENFLATVATPSAPHVPTVEAIAFNVNSSMKHVYAAGVGAATRTVETMVEQAILSLGSAAGAAAKGLAGTLLF